MAETAEAVIYFAAMRVLLASTIFLLASAAHVLASGSGEPKAKAELTRAPDNFQILVEAAQREKEVNVIGLPHDWMNYGEAITTFSRKYGIRVNELNPAATPAKQVEALAAAQRGGSQGPDVVDIDLPAALTAKARGLLASYRVVTWNSIPGPCKDADGCWTAGFYGTTTFEVNASFVRSLPRDWPDLLTPNFKGSVALAGDPFTSPRAILAICAAAIAAGGSFDNVRPGLDFFRELNARGNFIPLVAAPSTMVSGATPVTICWDYESLEDRASTGGNPRIEVISPASGVVACVSAQGVSASAPHPMAARLWMEFLFSDEGQLIFLKGRGHPARYADLEARGAITGDAAGFLPPLIAHARPLFPTPQQAASAAEYVSKNWNAIVSRESALHQAPSAIVPQAGGAGGTAEPRTGVVLSQLLFDDVFPVFYKYYDDHPIGSAVITNRGQVPAERVAVALAVKGYMTDRKVCAAFDRLEPGEKRQISLYGLFTEDVLKLTEGTKALANVSVEWTIDGRTTVSETVSTLRFLKRNNMSWGDDRRAAAFVTANDAAVMKFAKMTAGLVAAGGIPGVNEQLQKAMGIHEALALYGMRYVVDPNSSYAALSKTGTGLDYLQFPEETLEYKAGDCDDLAILECALLEAIGVETAFITVPGHIFAAVSLRLRPDEARRVFRRPDELICVNDETWIPIEVTQIRGGFNKAWREGALEWLRSNARGEAKLIPVHDAWMQYEPVAYASTTLNLSYPSAQAVAARFAEERDSFVREETSARIAELEALIEADPRKLDAVNALGVLYARYGMVQKAGQAFARILAVQEFLPALLNMGNLAFLAGDFESALGFCGRALALSPRNDQALLAAARINRELENYGAVRDFFGRLKAVNPALAAEYGFVLLRGEESTRGREVDSLRRSVRWSE